MTEGNLTEQNVSANEQVNPVVQQESEKLLKQSDVDRIVHARMNEAMNKGEQAGYRKAVEELKNQSSQTQSMQSAPSMGGMQQFTPDQIKQMVADESRRQVEHMKQEAYVQHVAQDLRQKLDSGKSKYSDFDEVVGPLRKDIESGNPALAQIALMAQRAGNPEDIFYDLGNNPHKVASLITLAHTSPSVAEQEMQKLSASIKQNEAAHQSQSVKEPLSQIRPSTTGTDNGAMSVRDFRSMFTA
jgi:hypothetical protein